VILGVHAGLQYTSTDEIRALWARIETLGFEWISVWDHFYAADVTDPKSVYECLEGLTAHAALAMATSKVRCGSLVYCAGYRHPAVMAKSIATIDNFSGGRVTLGLGAGWHQGEFDAYGIPFPPAPVRLRQLEETVQCIRALLTEDVVDFDGEFFQLREARCEPKPQQARLPIWLGGHGEKVTLKLVARHADGWNVPFVSTDTFRQKVGVLEAHCAAVDRDPATITKSLNLALAWNDEDLVAQFGQMIEFLRGSVLTGSPQQVVDLIGTYADAGADQINIAVRAPFDVGGLERFAAEVLPQWS
jgi:F420-dependent oxidoreductase-like protein